MNLKLIAKRFLRSNRFSDYLLHQWLGRPRRISVDGLKLSFEDCSRSLGHWSLVREFLRDGYGLRDIPFKEGDVVVDVGAHIGIESIYLAKRYPFLKIYAFEPVPDNFVSLERNLLANGITNVRAFQMAVTSDGRDVEIWVDLNTNSGGGGHDRPAEHFRGRTPYRAASITLDQIFSDHAIEECKLLKIDCEGAEHEILLGFHSMDKLRYLSGEFHIDAHLRELGYSIEDLVQYCERYIPRDHIRILRDEQ